jgi:hypothetical protein
MKTLSYLLGISILISGIDLIFTTSVVNLSACPRCRRALPKGPRKLPHPVFPKKERNQSPSMNNINNDVFRSYIKEIVNEK